MLEPALKAYMQRHAMTRPGDRVLAAVSGGADSTALLHLLCGLRDEFGLALFAAHLDHGIRPDSGQDALFVSELCARLGVPCTVERADAPALSDRERCSLEVAARRLRWDFLRREAARRDARVIATAHHRDDQAETVLLRLVRGSGTEGLRAMAPVDGDIIRPLLWAGHRQLTDYLQSRHEIWREDATNSDVEIPRNRIRHRVMPELAALNPRAAESIARSARLLQRDDDCLRALARDAFSMVEERDDGLFVPGTAASLHPAVLSRLLRLAAAELGAVRDVSALHIDEAMAALAPGQTGKALSWPGGLELRREAGGLLLCPAADIPVPAAVPLRVPGVTQAPGLGRFVCELVPSPPADPASYPPFVQHFDWALFPGDAQVRTRREGDRFLKLGAPGNRKLKDEMIDRKIPRWRRDRVPLIAAGNRVLWLVGCAVAHETRITDNTRAVLRIEYTKDTED